LILYDDNRQQQQKGASGVLEGLLAKGDVSLISNQQ
jgi:hypothetical protein